MESHTEKSCTDAFGEIKFFRYRMKSSMAKYVRVAADDSVDHLLELLKQYWDIDNRSFVISIISDGDVKNTGHSRKIKKAFYDCLIRIANRVTVCILTSGYHQGVIKDMSQTLNQDGKDSDNNKRHKHVIIVGISTWGAVLNRELLQSETGSGSYPAEYVAVRKGVQRYVPLDPNHTHFILADDGTTGQRAAEEVLRKELTKEWRKKNKQSLGLSRLIRIVISGNVESLHKVRDYVASGRTVVAVKDSGGASSALTYIKSDARNLNNRETRNKLKEILKYSTTDGTSMPDSVFAMCLEYIETIQRYLKKIIIYDCPKDEYGKFLLRILMGRAKHSTTESEVGSIDVKFEEQDKNSMMQIHDGTPSSITPPTPRRHVMMATSLDSAVTCLREKPAFQRSLFSQGDRPLKSDPVLEESKDLNIVPRLLDYGASRPTRHSLAIIPLGKASEKLDQETHIRTRQNSDDYSSGMQYTDEKIGTNGATLSLVSSPFATDENSSKMKNMNRLSSETSEMQKLSSHDANKDEGGDEGVKYQNDQTVLNGAVSLSLPQPPMDYNNNNDLENRDRAISQGSDGSVFGSNAITITPQPQMTGMYDFSMQPRIKTISTYDKDVVIAGDNETNMLQTLEPIAVQINDVDYIEENEDDEARTNNDKPAESTIIEVPQGIEYPQLLDHRSRFDLPQSGTEEAGDMKGQNVEESESKWGKIKQKLMHNDEDRASLDDHSCLAKIDLLLSRDDTINCFDPNESKRLQLIELLLLEDTISLTKIIANGRKNLSNTTLTKCASQMENLDTFEGDAYRDFSQFITSKTLTDLYELANQCVFYELYSFEYIHTCRDSERFNNNEQCMRTIDRVGNIIAMLVGHNYNNPYTEEKIRRSHSSNSIKEISIKSRVDCANLPIKDPYNQLFLWAALTSHDKLAFYLLEMVRYPIAAALLAAYLLIKLSNKMLDDEFCAAAQEYNFELLDDAYKTTNIQILRNRSREYIKLAIGITNVYYAAKPENAIISFMQELPDWENISCFSTVFILAHTPEMQDIVVQDFYQDCLTNLWTGGVEVLLCFIFPPLISCNMIKFKRYADSSQSHINVLGKKNENITSQKQLEEIAGIRSKKLKSSEVKTMQNGINCGDFLRSTIKPARYWEFYYAPRPIYILNLFFYVIFLVTYAGFIITRFRPYVRPTEIILIIWVSSLMLEEIRQIICSPKLGYKNKFEDWWGDHWNKTDALGIILFYTALAFRLFPHLQEVGRLLYCLDFIIFCLRILQLLSLRVNLGPKMAMIRHMVADLISFLIILFVFLVAFGVSTQAMLNPVPEWNSVVFKNIFYVPYYRIYGELFLDESLNCGNSNSSGVEQVWGYECVAVDIIVNILVVVYLLLTTILLLNLLIAIFNNTYNTIQDRADRIWKIQYNDLLREYLFRSPSVPPLNLFTTIKQLLPTNMKASFADWRDFLAELIQLSHLKIPCKNLKGSEIYKLKSLEDKYRTKYFNDNKKKLSELNVANIEEKLDTCLADTKRCQCGRKKHAGDRVVFSSNQRMKWDWEKHTRLQRTDAFGEIQFYRYGMKPSTAKYLRVSVDVLPSLLLSLLQKHWVINDPSLIVSIIAEGPTQDAIPASVTNLLCKGLVNLATDTAAYVLTSGYHLGVLKLISEVLKKSQDTNNEQGSHKSIPIIGIASWGSILNRRLLQNDKGLGCYPAKCVATRKAVGKFLPLDPSHTHFILADDGKVGIREAEETLRSRLEEHLLEKIFHTAGNTDTVEKIWKYLQKNLPVVIVANTGGAAELITSVKEIGIPQDNSLEHQICQYLGLKPSEGNGIESKVKECSNNILSIIQKEHLIHIYYSKKHQLNDVIYEAVVQAQQLGTNQRTALKVMWNRIEPSTPVENWGETDAYATMKKALLGDREDIVAFMLKENHGLDVNSFVTPSRLQDLYESAPEDSLLRLYISETIKPTYRNQSCKYYELNNIGKAIASLMGHDYCNPYSDEKLKVKPKSTANNQTDIENEAVQTEDEWPCEITEMKDAVYFDDPHRELFLWAVLTDRFKISMIFWQKLRYSVAGALVAANILLRMSESVLVKKNHKIIDKLKDRGSTFISLALGVINECYKENSDDAVLLFMQELPDWGNCSCFAIVFASSRMNDIIIHDCYQESLNNLWTGEIKTTTPIWKVLLCIACPFLVFTDFVQFKPHAHLYSFYRQNNVIPDANKITSQEDIEIAIDNVCSNCEQNQPRKVREKLNDQLQMSKFSLLRLEKFYTAPRMIFLLNMLTYVTFLIVYAVFIMTKLDGHIKPIEYVLIIWVSALGFEEVRQIIFAPKPRFISKLAYWWSDHWNKTDVLAIIAFYSAVIFRSFNETGEVGRLIYCVDFIIFFLRMLQMLSVRVNLGPKMAMIRHMVKDLISFIIILLVFLAAFGIATQAILYPVAELSSTVIKNIFYVPYYRIYGELFLEEASIKCLNSDQRNVTEDSFAYHCTSREAIVNILLVIYLLLTTILLLNLLIAIFNNTYGKIENEASRIWKIQYNNLLREYLFRSPSVPPLNYLPILYTLLPWNWKTSVASWNSYLKQLANLKHLKIPKKKIHVYDICRMQNWEKQTQISYLKKSKKSEVKEGAKRDKLDICLSKIEELANDLRLLKTQLASTLATNSSTSSLIESKDHS
ncbi:Transient receptor potential cation channel trpm [Trichoplax sp. H2]|nr:Transient receptor potential cation channel trpm [Trichoplax sp. H2]|eukprot:RDD38223.1 Transient receptor potential cation channel trpm [Trichoplax sp. H2]